MSHSDLDIDRQNDERQTTLNTIDQNEPWEDMCTSCDGMFPDEIIPTIDGPMCFACAVANGVLVMPDGRYIGETPR